MLNHTPIDATALAALLRPLGVDGLDALIILGSGMSDCFAAGAYQLLDHGEDAGVAGHAGKLALMRVAGRRCLVSMGRRHLYEGYRAADVSATVCAAALLGASTLIVTNAAGALNPRFDAGDIMLIDGCIGSFLGVHARPEPGDHHHHNRVSRDTIPPGLFLSAHRERDPFAISIYPAIEAAALERGVRLLRGVYAGVLGPSYETRAEIRMLRRLGADAVGMSTLPEITAACSHAMRTVGLSLLTNVLTDTASVGLDHAHVVEQGRQGLQRMRAALEACVEELSKFKKGRGGYEV